MNTLKVGIIGFGLSGRVFHAPFINVNPKFTLTKIFSSRKAEINKLYPGTMVVDSVEDIILDTEIDLVIITSPNTEHYPQTKAALENEKHVIVEKPFVINATDGEKLIQLARTKNKVLAVFQNRRWDGDFMTVKNIVNANILGHISEFESHFDRYRPEIDLSNWRSQDVPGAGELYNLGPHLIDQAIALFGTPEAVYGDLRIARKEGTVADTFEIILHYPHHRAILKAGILVKENAPHFMIHGSKGSFTKSGLDPQEALLKTGAIPDGADWGKDDAALHGKLNIELNGLNIESKVETLHGNYMGFFDNVHDAITKGAALEVPAEEALLNIKIIEIAMRSAKEKRVIEVN